ncbi:MAG: PH domain-containing protein [Spirochaetales bacterium]|nr:PH domain-containing protein [Spirochaetales bacterium]
MIQTIIGTLRFLEAKAVLNAQKEDRLFPFFLNLFLFSLLLHIAFLFPLFFSQCNYVPAIMGIGIVSLLAFSILFLRILLLIRSKNKLNNILEYHEKDLDSLKTMITSGIKTNMATFLYIFAAFLVYSFIVYGILSFFLASSFIFFFVSFLFIALVAGIIFLGIFLYFYLKDKDLLWPKSILPVASGIISFFLLLTFRLVFPLHPLFIYMCSFSSGWFFTYPLFKKLLGDKNFVISYRFILFCYFIILVLFLISTFTPEQYNNIDGIPFLQPVFASLISLFHSINTFFISNMVIAVLFPHFFVPVLLLSRTIYDAAFRFRQKLHRGMFTNRSNMELIFSGGLSLYHLFWVLLRTGIITGIVYVEIKPVSDLLYSLIKLFKVPEIFHLDFLTQDNIFFFFTLVFYIILAALGLKCLDRAVMYMCSTFSLFITDLPADKSTIEKSAEAVYMEKRLLSRTVLCIPLKKIHYIMYHQDICERFFDTGTIRIETSDNSGIISIRGVPRIKEKYNQLIDKAKSAV